ncbi:MAG: hypothetical protein JWO31_936 [Phycisphaerales bacterium]|nr:hypothetical protein [Phycisphaerales bacterium]
MSAATEDAERWRRIAYKLGRHVRNTDRMPATTWGVKGIDLLVELRAMDPSRYSREVRTGRQAEKPSPGSRS